MDSVEKRIAEQLGVRRELSGYTRIENGDVIYKASDYRELCEHLWDALLASERSREWIKVTPETMPKQNTKVLVACYTMGGKWVQPSYWKGGDTCNWAEVDGGVRVKFWQPLPALPSEEEQK